MIDIKMVFVIFLGGEVKNKFGGRGKLSRPLLARCLDVDMCAANSFHYGT